MVAFIEAASERGIAVYFDIVINHTGDVITFEEEVFSYRGMGSAPYLTAGGEEFDPGTVAGTAAFPDLDAEISFPYTPALADPEDATIKAPSAPYPDGAEVEFFAVASDGSGRLVEASVNATLGTR